MALVGSGGVEVWDLSTGETRRVGQAWRGLCTAAAFAGRRPVVGRSDGTIGDRPIHVRAGGAMTLSPHGRVLAWIGEGMLVRFVRGADL